MMRLSISHLLLLFFALTGGVVVADEGSDEGRLAGWPGFRGRGDSHVRGDANLPLRWSEASGIAWRKRLEGYGQSSPVAFGKIAYVTSSGGEQKQFMYVEAFDIDSGDRIWLRTIDATQRVEEVSQMVSRGAPTPVADASGVYAFFESGDLVAFNPEGKERWQRSLTKEYGEFKGGHGVGSSLVNAGDSLVLLVDHDGPSYLLSIDKETGANRWKADREPRVSWTTPTIVTGKGEPQIVVSSNGIAEGYRLRDGERLWWFEGLEKNTVASPSSDGNLVVVASSAPQNSLAIRLGGKGDVTETHRVWVAESVTTSFSSPLIEDGVVYFINRAGTLQANRLADGKQLWERRLPDGCWASPLAVSGRLYFFCKNGKTVVLPSDAEETTPPLSENAVPIGEKERIYGFAVGEGCFIARTGEEVFCLR